MSQIPRDFIELLLTKIDVIDLINTRIPLKKKSGSNFFARCPFHQEKSASFSVSQPKQFFYCFGCGAHGNAIDFLMQHDHLNFPEAVETLARTASMEVPRDDNTPRKPDTMPALYDLVMAASKTYYEQMCHSERAIQYLKNRGISGKTAQQFQIGYAPPGWQFLFDNLGKTETLKKHLELVGLTIAKKEGGAYDRFRDRIMFPIHDYRGRLIGFGGRIIDDGEPKYLNSPETPLFQKGQELYGLYQALKAHRDLARVLVVEGYMDVIMLFQHGITYAVATLGTATTAKHLQRLFRYTADIIFCFDGDKAGRTAAWRALEVIFPLMHDSLQVRFLFLPEGEDPDSLVQKEGKAAFEKRLDTAPSLSSFFFQTLSTQCDMSTMEGRARLSALALSHIKQLPGGVFKDIVLAELSKRARVDLTTLKKQAGEDVVTDTPTDAPKPSAEVAEPLIGKSKLNNAMRLTLALLVQNPNLVNEIRVLPPNGELPGLNFLCRLIEMLQKDPNINTAQLLERFRGEKEEDFLAKLAGFNHLVPESGLATELNATLKKLASLEIENKINNLLSMAAQQSLSDQEKQRLTDLINEKSTILA